MLNEADRSAIVELSRRYGARRVLLFGSSADTAREGNDIDLAVEGVPPSQFFSYFGDLIFSLSKPLDLVDLSRDSKFNRLIARDGIAIYEQPS
jgi:predicted nucleotidyltransferase